MSETIQVLGKTIDNETRCEHYHSQLDIIAIKFKCCLQYFPCHSCHNESVDHEPEVWPKELWDSKAVLCGHCKYEMSINEYLQSNNQCPSCNSQFNPGCSNHYHLYFAF